MAPKKILESIKKKQVLIKILDKAKMTVPIILIIKAN